MTDYKIESFHPGSYNPDGSAYKIRAMKEVKNNRHGSKSDDSMSGTKDDYPERD